MITKIIGKLTELTDDVATLASEPFEYEVLIPDFTRRQLQTRIGEPVDLHTLHYIEGNPAHGRLTPRLVGFTSTIEREFFEMICQVDGVGVRKALRAMVRPVRDVAALIEGQDTKGLSTLPGIGPAIAERIVAKLRRKMPKFLLMVPDGSSAPAEVAQDLVRDTFAILCQLGHAEADARRLLDGVLGTKKKFKDVDELLQAVYQSSHKE